MQLGKTMEVYIYDMIVKPSKANDHVLQLLGYLVTETGIEANPKQIAALIDTLPPRSIREVHRLTGKIAALNCFISRSTDRCLPFYKLLKGNKKFEWNTECDSTLKELKTYISKPPIFSQPIIGETLLLYVATSEHAVSGFLIREESGEQRPICYIS